MWFGNPGSELLGNLKLSLLDHNYKIGTFWDSRVQTDLLVEHNADRISRIIECKWTQANSEPVLKILSNLKDKAYQPPRGFACLYCLITSQPISKETINKAGNNCVIIQLEDLF